MKCHKCKTEIPDRAKFCNICGSEMDVQGKTCPNTNCSKTGLSHEALFCPDCGTELMGYRINEKKEKEVIPQSNIYIEKNNLFQKLEFVIISLILLVILRFLVSFFIFLFLVVILFLINTLYLINYLFENSHPIKIGVSENIIMIKKCSRIGTIYLTSKRLIYQRWSKIVWECNLNANDVDINIWFSLFKTQKGLTLIQKYEKIKTIKLNKPQKWYDKIKELRNTNNYLYEMSSM